MTDSVRPRGAHFKDSNADAAASKSRAAEDLPGVLKGFAGARPDETSVFLAAAARAQREKQGGAAGAEPVETAPEATPMPAPDESGLLFGSPLDETAAFAAAERSAIQVETADEQSTEMSPDYKNVNRSTMMMSVLVIISRITGFLRTWIQAFVMGASITASAFTVANNLPNALYELVMGGMLVTAFLPVYVSAKKESGKKGAIEYASNILSLVFIAMMILVILSFVFAGQIIWTQTFSASSDFDFELSIYFFRFFAVEIVLYALSSVISSVLNAERDYFWSTAAPIVNNIVMTAAFLGYYRFFDSDPQLALLFLAIGNPLGVLVQVLCQLPSLRRVGVKLNFRVDVHDPRIRETLSLGIPTLIVTLVSFATTSVQSSCSLSVNPNGAAITYYARMWYVLPYSVFAIPITTAMFTELSTSVADGDYASLVSGIRMGTKKILFLLIPFMFYLIVFSPLLARMLGSGGMSDESLDQLAGYLACLSISLPIYGVCTYLQKVCSSMRRMKLFTIAEVIAGFFQIVLCMTLTPVFGFNLVAISSVAFFTAIDLVIFAFLRRELGPLGIAQMARSILKYVLLGAMGALVGWLVLCAFEMFVDPVGRAGMVRLLLYTVVAGSASVVVTYGTAMVLHMDEVSFILPYVNRLKRFLPGSK